MKELITENRSDLPSIVFGGGGAFGIGYESGIVDTLRDRGIDLHGAHMLGTSAGSWVAGFVAADKGFDDVADMPQIKVPNYKPGYLRGYSREIFGDARDEHVNAVVFKLPGPHSRSAHPRILNGADYDLADLAWASSSVPGVFYPAEIDGEYYIDGGVRSIASGDLAPRSRKLLAIAAFGAASMPPAGSMIEFKMKHELRKWRNKNNGEVIYIRPNHEISSLIRNPLDVFDFELAKDAYWMAREQAETIIRDPSRGLGKLVLDLITSQP